MKKVLLGTTALVAATMVAAPGAQAAEKIKLGLGGFMWQTVGWADQDSDFETAGGTNYRDWDQKSASEVHFKGSTKLDNGVTVAVKIELEADSNVDGDGGSHIDSSYLKVTSPTLGQLVIGKSKGVGRVMGHVGVNYAGITRNAGDVRTNHWIVQPGSVDLGFADETALDDNGDENRVTYMTPRFMGFGAGVSLVPDTDNAHPVNMPDKSAATVQGGKVTAVLAYDGTIAGVKVGADVGWLNQGDTSGAGEAGVTGVGSGLVLGYAGFTLGGSWMRYNQGTNTGGQDYDFDGHKWDVGLGYKTGPYAVSIYYTHEESADDAGTSGHDEADHVIIGGTYTLGPGVDLKAGVFHVDWQDETNANANNNEGWGVTAGMFLKF